MSNTIRNFESICTSCQAHIGVIEYEMSEEGMPVRMSLTVTKTTRFPDKMSVECPGCKTKVDIIDSMAREEMPLLKFVVEGGGSE